MRSNWIFLLSTLSIAFAYNFTKGTFTCTDVPAGTPFKRGDALPICMHFISDDGSSKKAPYKIKVDDYSAITVNGAQAAYGKTKADFTETHIAVQVDASHMTFPLPFVNRTKGEVVLYADLYSVVIRLSDGVVSELIWDNTCALCGGTPCFTDKLLDNNNNEVTTDLCNVESTCGGEASTSSTCDPKVYVSFVGTDKDGVTLTSAGIRLSRFVEYSVQDMYRQAQGVVTTTVSDVKESVNDAKESVTGSE